MIRREVNTYCVVTHLAKGTITRQIAMPIKMIRIGHCSQPSEKEPMLQFATEKYNQVPTKTSMMRTTAGQMSARQCGLNSKAMRSPGARSFVGYVTAE